MEGIPPVRASDNEDVIWALETAESLWKRNARVDAIVWLRRAAQEAADAGDDDRAAALLAEASVLTETIGRSSTQSRAPASLSVVPPAGEEDVDALLATGADSPPAVAASLELEEELEILEELDESDVLSLAPTTPIPSGESGGAEEVSTYGDFEGVTPMGQDALSLLDLQGVSDLAAVSDLQRQRMLDAATVVLCAVGAAIPPFALALVLEGQVSAMAGAGGPTVARLRQGSILSTRGTFDVLVPLHFAATADDTTVALWTEVRLAAGLLGDETVDDGLRAQGDSLQAWALVAKSPMGLRLHEDVRLRLVERLTTRRLRPGAELVVAGGTLPGILLVGVGTVTVDAPAHGVLGPGEFVFPEAALSAARVSGTARAGKEGAVVLCADRQTTQELWATEPLLLEVLASSL